MVDSERPRFNLRLTPELEAALVDSSKKNGRSKNAEILAALEGHYGRDPVLALAEAMRPLIETLTQEQQAQLVELVKAMAAGKKRRR